MPVGNVPFIAGAAWLTWPLPILGANVAAPNLSAPGWSAYNASAQGAAVISVAEATGQAWDVIGGTQVQFNPYAVAQNVGAASGGTFQVFKPITVGAGWTESVPYINSTPWTAASPSLSIGPTVGVSLASSTAWSTLAVAAQTGNLISLAEANVAGWSAFAPSINLGVEPSIALAFAGYWTSVSAKAQTGSNISVAIVAISAAFTNPATAQTGSLSSLSIAAGGSLSTFAPSIQTGVLASPSLAIALNWIPFQSAAQFIGTGRVGLVNGYPWEAIPVSVQGSVAIYAGSGTALPWAADVAYPVPFDGTLYPITWRQAELFTQTANTYRQTNNASLDNVYRPLIARLPCFMHTTPNVDQDIKGLAPGMFKEEGVFLYNRFNFPIQADVQPGDIIQVFINGSPDNGAWYTVRGATRPRAIQGDRDMNKGMVYLNPTVAPDLT